MKKLKNKFILGVIFIISIIIFSQVYIAYSNSNVDTNSYLTLVKGNATLNESYIQTGDKYILHVGDNIRVIGDSSLAVIDWGDGSVTRLGGNTKISIDQNQVSRDFTNINISFDLIAGKTWSNVISFIGKDSSFTQTFQGLEAGVRGTIFDVDLDNEFIHVSDHEVSITTPDGKEILISEGSALKLDSLSIVNITEFIESLEDKTWKKINEEFDNEYINFLKKELSETLTTSNPFLFILEWISPKYKLLYTLNTAEDYAEVEKVLREIPDEDAAKVYDAVLSKYQKMNFISVSDYEFYKRKVFYQKTLIVLASEQNKQIHVRRVSYDIAEIVELGEVGSFGETISSLLENQDILQSIDVSFLREEIDRIPQGLRSEFGNSLKDLENILKSNTLQDININNAGEKIQQGLDAIDKGIQDMLGKNAGKLLENFVE